MPILFNGPKNWKEKIISADNIVSQVKAILQANNLKLPETPRRPDIRLIVDNVTGLDKIFRNPANHSNDKAECVPGAGDKKAAMVMVAGDTLEEQYANARLLFDRFDLGHQGLSSTFLQAVAKDGAGGLVKEAYGPAPLEEQVKKLVDVDWTDAKGRETHIKPVSAMAAAFGARAATAETALNACVQVFIQGTSTIPELMETPGTVIAINSDWKTGTETTRPIFASVAKEFYGNHYDTMPQVTVHPDGYVIKVDLKNGMVFEMASDAASVSAAPQPARG